MSKQPGHSQMPEGHTYSQYVYQQQPRQYYAPRQARPPIQQMTAQTPRQTIRMAQPYYNPIQPVFINSGQTQMAGQMMQNQVLQMTPRPQYHTQPQYINQQATYNPVPATTPPYPTTPNMTQMNNPTVWYNNSGQATTQTQQRPPSNGGMQMQPQRLVQATPNYQKRERKGIAIIDPSSGKDMLEELDTEHKEEACSKSNTPTMSENSSARDTPVATILPPPPAHQEVNIAAEFAAIIAATLSRPHSELNEQSDDSVSVFKTETEEEPREPSEKKGFKVPIFQGNIDFTPGYIRSPRGASENAWKTKNILDKPTEEVKTQDLLTAFRGILDKLTSQNVQTLVQQVLDLKIDSEPRLNGVINLIFEKAIDEPSFNVAYANMCKCLMMIKVPLGYKPNEFVNFRKLLLIRCQHEFERYVTQQDAMLERSKEIEDADTEEKKTLIKLEIEEAEMKSKRRTIGNIRFIGELFKLKILTENIVHDCLFKLFKAQDEDSLEYLCHLLTTIGKDIDTPKDKQRVDQYFHRMETIIIKSKKTSSRVKLMMQDVIELRKNAWVPHCEDNNPKTIHQIHEEPASEAREKQVFGASHQGHQGHQKPRGPPRDEEKSATEIIEQSSKWTSKRYCELLEKLNKLPKDDLQKDVSPIKVCCRKDYRIGKGSDGTTVYVGLLDDGIEVAVKRVDADNDHYVNNEANILNVIGLRDPYIVQYKYLKKDPEGEYAYLILELCECTLDEYIKDHPDKLASRSRIIIEQLLKGLKKLHEQKVLHRDLKPQNVFVDVNENIRLADFGISRRLNPGQNTVVTKPGGSRCWRAQETLKDYEPQAYKKSSDIQVAGMLVYYILSGGLHPYGKYETEQMRNLEDGNPDLFAVENTVAKDLILMMLEHEPEMRLSAKACLKHPYFWPSKERFAFLEKTGNQQEVKGR